jgi:hypothetical protein
MFLIARAKNLSLRAKGLTAPSRLRYLKDHRPRACLLVCNGNAPFHVPEHWPFCSGWLAEGVSEEDENHVLHDRVRCLRAAAPCESSNRSGFSMRG